MSDLLKQKLDIAKRAGELHKELERLREMRYYAVRRKDGRHGIYIKLSLNGSEQYALNSGEWGDDDTLLDAIIGYIEARIAEREAEVNELIKILS